MSTEIIVVTPRPRKRHRGLVAVIVIVVVLVLLVVGYFVAESFARSYANNYVREKVAAAVGLKSTAPVHVNLGSGDIVQWIRIEGAVSELYDIAVLPGVRRPLAASFTGPEINDPLTFET